MASVGGLLDDLLALAEIPENNPEALAAWRFDLVSPNRESRGN
jgi:hypothetical protein